MSLISPTYFFASPLLSKTGMVRHRFYDGRYKNALGEVAPPSISEGEGQAVLSEHNRRHIAECLGAQHIFINRQIHSNEVRIIAPDTDPEAHFRGDALVTTTRRLALGVLTADCAPLLLVDPQAEVIGAAHAGWRGALGGVVEAVITAMRKQGAKAENIHGAIGPTIAAGSYRVRLDFFEHFQEHSPLPCAECFTPATEPEQTPQGDPAFYFDLPGYVRLKLASCGVTEIDTLAHDTYSEVNFCSHRSATERGEVQSMRQLNVIMLI